MSRTSASLKFRASTLMRSVCRVLLHETQRAVVVTPAPDDSTFTMLCGDTAEKLWLERCRRETQNVEPYARPSHGTSRSQGYESSWSASCADRMKLLDHMQRAAGCSLAIGTKKWPICRVSGRQMSRPGKNLRDPEYHLNVCKGWTSCTS